MALRIGLPYCRQIPSPIMTHPLSAKVIFITGCSSGFGLEIARLLCRTHRVYASMRNMRKKEALLNAIRPQENNLSLLECDVTQADSISSCVKIITEKEGRLDVLINNAGYGLGGYFEDLSESDIRAQLDTNFFGLQAVTRAFLPLLRQHRGGRIVMISSIAGLAGMPGMGAYNASKWAVEGFSESLYFELKPFGIDVVLVEPGPYQTNIFSRNLKLGAHAANAKSPYFKRTQALLHKIETGMSTMQGDPRDVASLVQRIIEKKSIGFRYLIGRSAWLRYLAKKWLPFSIYSVLFIALFNRLVGTKRPCHQSQSQHL